MENNFDLIKKYLKVSHPHLFTYSLFLILTELVFRTLASASFFGIGLVYIVIFSVPAAAVLTFITCLFKYRLRLPVQFIIQTVIIVFYSAQVVYYKIFGVFFTLFSALNGGSAFQFSEAIGPALVQGLPWIIFFILIGCGIIFFLYKSDKKKCGPCEGQKCKICSKTYVINLKSHFIAGGLILLLQFTAFILLFAGGTSVLSPFDTYMSSTAAQAVSVDSLGFGTTFRLDAQRCILGYPEKPADYKEGDSEKTDTGKKEEKPKYKPNTLNIDFEKLAAETDNKELSSLDEYFASVSPTDKNKFTGKYKGYNLIYITAEGFSPFAIDKDLTPTLYMLYTKGVKFTNFYNPIWGVSTSDGEYVNCQSLIPKSGVWSMKKSSSNTLPFTLGNQFKKLGYTTLAYHNHSFTYYDRDKSHPNLGYTFKAPGHGLTVKKQWPESDVEMMENSVADYIDEDKFHVYYMTVSGHLLYNWGGNAMCAKHKDEVADLPYSETCKAYISCNIEFDRAMKSLLSSLKEAGVLNHTVIAIVPDHYPYGLENEDISEFLGHKVDTEFELYRSCFLLYAGDMKKPLTVTKPCCAMDVLPTLSNLFGLDYDSRLLMGRDIFSDADPFVVFNSRNWISKEGRYTASTSTFKASKNCELEDEEAYVDAVNKKVSDMFSVSAKILDTNYYKHCIPKETGK